jgi:hypothetical protein
MSAVTHIRPGDCLPEHPSDASKPTRRGQAYEPKPPAIPAYGVLQKRLREEQTHIYRAQDIVRIAAEVLDLRDDEENHSIWSSLQTVINMLTDAAGNLEPVTLLSAATEETHL